MKPTINTPVPGPNAAKIVERDTAALMTSTKTSPIAAKSARGVWVEDVDGNTFLDLTAGIGVVNVGHSHPKVVAAVKDQADKMFHFAGTDFYYDVQVSFAERLAAALPGNFDRKVFFTNSGTESNEAAIKIAKHATGRQQFIGFIGAFHGRTIGSMGFTASKPTQKKGFFPWMPGVTHVPFPNPYRNVWGIDGYEDPAELTTKALDYIEGAFQTMLAPEDVAAIWFEPVQGEGGYVVPPMDFYPKLARLAADHGILMAADEVQTGFGRTGKMFGQEHYGLESDIVMMAKGIANGMPMGAVAARAELDFTRMGAHSNTYGGNLMACASGIATLDVLQTEGLVDNAATVGAYFKRRLTELADKHDCIGDVRGLGLMLASDFVKDRRSKEPAPKIANGVVSEGMKRGLVLLPCGKSAVRYIPPLCITQEEVEVAIAILDEAIAVASA